MKKLFLSATFMMVLITLTAQNNVGIGTGSPISKLQITDTSAKILLLENTTALGSNISSAMYFKTGAFYTGGLGTYGTGTTSARLGFSTFTSFSPNSLKEQLSILDNGNIGMGTLAPTARLSVVSPSTGLSTDADVLLLQNAAALSNTTNTKLYFKAGGFYTGSIGTYGTGINSARLAFSTFSSAATGGLQERMSILDNGNVGINNANPGARLDVAGRTKLTQGTDAAAVEIDGRIKVSGANKAAFLMTVVAGNLSNGGKTLTIDNPLCNGDPNAMIFVTAREMTLGVGGFIVKYNASIQKWQLLTDNYTVRDLQLQGDFVTCGTGFCGHGVAPLLEESKFKVDDKFNVLIISN